MLKKKVKNKGKNWIPKDDPCVFVTKDVVRDRKDDAESKKKERDYIRLNPKRLNEQEKSKGRNPFHGNTYLSNEIFHKHFYRMDITTQPII